MVTKVKGATAKFNASGYVSTNAYTGKKIIVGKKALDQKQRSIRALAKAKARIFA